MAVSKGKVFIPDEGTDRVHVPVPAKAEPTANTGYRSGSDAHCYGWH